MLTSPFGEIDIVCRAANERFPGVWSILQEADIFLWSSLALFMNRIFMNPERHFPFVLLTLMYRSLLLLKYVRANESPKG